MSRSQQSDQAGAVTPRPHAALPYAIAILGVLVATAITRSVPVLHKNASTAVYFLVVMFASYKGGFRPAMLSVVLSAALWALFIIPPDYSFVMQSSGDVVRLLIFIFVAVLNSSLFEQLSKARRDVRKQQARLDLALEAGRMGVWDYDLIQDEFWISPEIRDIFGVGDGEFSPTYGGFLAFVHPEDRAMVVRAMTTSRENRTDYQLEHRLIRRDKVVRWIATRGRTFCDANGRAERMIGLVVDVTEFRDGESASATDAGGADAGAAPVHSGSGVGTTASDGPYTAAVASTSRHSVTAERADAAAVARHANSTVNALPPSAAVARFA